MGKSVFTNIRDIKDDRILLISTGEKSVHE